MSKNTKATWTAIRQHLKSWESEALIALIKDLHDSSSVNRDFLHARVTAAAGGEASLASYRKRVTDPFYPARGQPKLKLGEARKAIREYRKATGDVPGTIDLLLVLCETGAEFTNEYGDINERFYDSLDRGLDDLCKMIREQGRAAWEAVSDRLDQLVSATENTGWGYGDHTADAVEELRESFTPTAD